MDKATEHLLLQEAKIEQLQNSMKVILPNIKAVFLKPNNSKIKTILKRLPNKDLKAVERDAIRQIPGFKQDYLSAQRKVSRMKIHPYMKKPTAAATALVSSTTNNSVDDVLNKGNMAMRNAKLTSLIPGSSLFPLIKFGIFAAFVASLFLTGGESLIPTIKVIIRAIVLMLGLISGALKGLLALGSEPGAGAAEKIFPTLSGSSIGELPIDKFLQNTDDLTKFVPDA